MTKNVETSKINEAVDFLIEGDVDLSNALSEDGLIKQLSKRALEKALQVEMDDHLGYANNIKWIYGLRKIKIYACL